MNLGKKMLWGGLGWALGGPIGAIIGYSFASMSGQHTTNYNDGYQNKVYPKTQPGDFIVSLLVLFGAVMKADKKMLKSELEFVKQFLSKQFGQAQVQDFMTLFKDIIKQDYPLRDVCKQIVRSMDHPSRLELIHILFGLSKADGNVDKDEVKVIQNIASYLNVNHNDFSSIKAMFFRDTSSDYTILEIKINASDDELKKTYRKMAAKYHPDKVNHLGNDLRELAEEKFKLVNEAYQNIKKERGLN
ncbi:TerB family tellurite resistance protein [Candidatus Marinimicrobia bacterium]|nr:TerB family tellurite resistance protein [Candidatus Neomarinimicrobiota bacterium]